MSRVTVDLLRMRWMRRGMVLWNTRSGRGLLVARHCGVLEDGASRRGYVNALYGSNEGQAAGG